MVVATFGEVNTGAFTRDIDFIHGICQKYNAWLHIDAAFGILARIHPQKQKLSKNLELADSISFDGHKFFNVPYDCGYILQGYEYVKCGLRKYWCSISFFVDG